MEIPMHTFSLVRRCSLSYTLFFMILFCSCADASTKSVAGACSNNIDSPIRNFCVVTPDVLWRGARPDKDDAAWLIQQGVRTIVNLELIHDDKPAFSQAIVADADNHEVDYFHINDWEPLPMVAPSVADDHVAYFLAIMSQQPKPVYVHCRSGKNRTGVMIAAYRIIIEGSSDKKAIEEMGLYQGRWFKPDAEYIRSLSKRREEIRQKIMEWILKLKKDAQVVCANGKCVISEH
jgi:protein tyrosine phosphatase (PTP) superfamily phosphohydrolase (DUF442 family)